MTSACFAGEPILIVDDERTSGATLRMVLEGGGHVIHEGRHDREADAILAREVIDLVLLDVELGEDNELDLLRALKARGEDAARRGPRRSRIVMISGHATIEDAVAATGSARSTSWRSRHSRSRDGDRAKRSSGARCRARSTICGAPSTRAGRCSAART